MLNLLIELGNFGRNHIISFDLFVFVNVCSVERDAQLLANRIALLKQEEMKTRKKIEETRKRA